jgi:hypothetical protein
MLIPAIETYKEYKNILLGYSIIVSTDHKKYFQSLKSFRPRFAFAFTLWTIWRNAWVPPKKVNVVADALSCLDISSQKIQEEEVLTLLKGTEEPLTLLSESENSSRSNIKLLHSQCILLVLQRISKSQDKRA